MSAARRGAPLVLTVAGSDPSGGAGLQADLRTFEACGVDGAAVVTAITVQDGARVLAVEPLTASLVRDQLRTVLDALPVRVIKCGMLASPAIVCVVAAELAHAGLPLVVDPVMRATGGEPLGRRGVGPALVAELLPLASVVTANLDEAAALTGLEVGDERAMAAAAENVCGLGAKAAVVKGGHLDGRPIDVLWAGRRLHRYQARRLGGGALHGSGCAFSSALAAELALGRSLVRAVVAARRHVRTLIAASVAGPGRTRRRQPLRRRGR